MVAASLSRHGILKANVCVLTSWETVINRPQLLPVKPVRPQADLADGPTTAVGLAWPARRIDFSLMHFIAEPGEGHNRTTIKAMAEDG